MKWKQQEIDTAVNFLASGFTYSEIGEILTRSRKAVKEKLNDLGYNFVLYSEKRFYCVKNCQCCNTEFQSLVSEKRKFCSNSCSAKVNNLLKVTPSENIKARLEVVMGVTNRNERKRLNYESSKQNECLNCKSIIYNKFCDSKCQAEFRTRDRIEKIEAGDSTLDFRHYKKYLIDKYGPECMECGWSKTNPFSGKIPVELEHVDGNSSNNCLSNLKLLCPSCHSLTPTYKSLNTGNGRYGRRERYKQGKSF